LVDPQQLVADVVVHARVVAIEEPAVAAQDDARRRRHAQAEVAQLAVPAHERRAKTEVILEPRGESLRKRAHGLPSTFERRKRGHGAVLDERVCAVEAGQIRGQRQQHQKEKQRDQRASGGHQNRK
jgi:hypothetical protein